MKTPNEKYMNDPNYKMLVDTFESLIHKAEFTPSEIREAAMLACINYEMQRPAQHLYKRNTEDVCPTCGSEVTWYHNKEDGISRAVCAEKCSGWEVLKEFDRTKAQRGGERC